MESTERWKKKVDKIRIYENNYNSTITEKQAKFIIDNHYVISQRKLSEIVGCHVTTIQNIHSNKSWKHIPR